MRLRSTLAITSIGAIVAYGALSLPAFSEGQVDSSAVVARVELER
jgi:hypothetical protein